MDYKKIETFRPDSVGKNIRFLILNQNVTKDGIYFRVFSEYSGFSGVNFVSFPSTHPIAKTWLAYHSIRSETSDSKPPRHLMLFTGKYPGWALTL